LFVGTSLLGFSKKEVGRMTLKKFMKLYKHYKTYYDFRLTNRQFKELEEKQNPSNNWTF